MKTLYVKRRIFQTEVNITGIVVNGLVHHTPKAKILTNIRKEIAFISKKCRLNAVETNQMYYQAISMYNQVSKKTWTGLRKLDKQFGEAKDYEESLTRRTLLVYNTVRKDYIMNHKLVQNRNVVAYNVENRLKHDEIWGKQGLFASNQADSDRYSPFFLCSSHPKPAKDHAEWEGKMYFDEDWKNFILDEADRARIESYIRNHKLRSAQWVCGEPVWLCTRRNCKHFLVPIPVDDVLHASKKSLLKRFNMIMPDERPLTPQIEAYRRFYERNKVETALYKLIPNEKLAEDIKKDQILMQKWAATAYRAK